MHSQALATARSKTLVLESDLIARLQPFLTRHNLSVAMALEPGRRGELHWVIPLPAGAGTPRRELVLETCGPTDLCIWARGWCRWHGHATEARLLAHLVTLPEGAGQVSACLETARHLALGWDHSWLYRHGRVTRGSIAVAKSPAECPARVGNRVVFTAPGPCTPLPSGYRGEVTQVCSSYDLLVVDDLPFATAWQLFATL